MPPASCLFTYSLNFLVNLFYFLFAFSPLPFFLFVNLVTKDILNPYRYFFGLQQPNTVFKLFTVVSFFSSKWRLIVSLLYKACFNWERPCNLPHIQVLVVANDVDRPSIHLGKYYSQTVDLLAHSLSDSVLGIARLLDSKVSPSTLIPVTSLPGCFSRALISKHIQFFLEKFFKRNSPLLYSLTESKLWSSIIDATSPLVVLAINPSRELCHIASLRSIPCFDVQHGNIYSNHPYYSLNRSGEPCSWLPTGYLLWTSYAASVLNENFNNASNFANTFVIGNIMFQCLGRFDSLKLLFSYDHSSFFSSLIQDPRKVILVTLSWGSNTFGFDMISSVYIDLINATSDVYRWVIRLHPSQLTGDHAFEYQTFLKDFLPKLPLDSFCEQFSLCPLALLSDHLDLHLTEWSSSATELALLGIPSIATNPYTLTSGFYDPSLVGEWITILPNADTLLLTSQIKSLLIKFETSPYQLHSDFYASEFLRFIQLMATYFDS